MRTEHLNVVLFGAYSVLGALVYVGAKLGLPYIPPLVFAALRLDVAGILLLTVVGLRGTPWLPQTRRDVLSIALTGVFTLGVMNALLFAGQQYVSGALGAIVYSLIPVMMTFFAVVLLPEASIDTVSAFGILLGLVGVVFVASPNPANLLTTRVLGVVLLLSSVVVFALGSVVTQRLNPPLSRVTLTAWGALLAGVLNHAVGVAAGVGLGGVEWTTQALVALFVVGVFATGVLYTIHFELIDRIGPSRTSLTFYIHPVIAAALGWLLFQNGLAASAVLGFALIMLGFLLVERRLLFG